MPKPEIRNAKPADAERMVELIRYLGHEIDEKALRKNLKALKKTGELPLVATLRQEDRRNVRGRRPHRNFAPCAARPNNDARRR